MNDTIRAILADIDVAHTRWESERAPHQVNGTPTDYRRWDELIADQNEEAAELLATIYGRLHDALTPPST
ncbi:hypothetical protein Afil01_61940 [Actinorhabdospora filicis]|uniref:Uncharacterized protein n=1 Tax=Actinorhabdospora filicis TaxID=1785913 RepID=A0A9W6SSC3_9ACTN|nr:hypothetical protein [Actinorhabdospora filicis]GLZ81387.1 hypothetical protein Afil01_61940 [Actinorhabdospora filicis]